MKGLNLLVQTKLFYMKTKMYFLGSLVAISLTAFWVVDRFKRIKKRKEKGEKRKNIKQESDLSISFLNEEEVLKH